MKKYIVSRKIGDDGIELGEFIKMRSENYRVLLDGRGPDN